MRSKVFISHHHSSPNPPGQKRVMGSIYRLVDCIFCLFNLVLFLEIDEYDKYPDITFLPGFLLSVIMCEYTYLIVSVRHSFFGVPFT